jgi:hypothetical protein
MFPSAARHLLDRLTEFRDARTGLPIDSHRRRVGAALVLAKKGFRKSLQPFLNEALRKQALFNDAALDTFKSLYRELASLESAVLAFRTASDVRIRKLEDAVSSLQQPASAEASSLHAVPDSIPSGKER